MSKTQQFKPVLMALLAAGMISGSGYVHAGERESLEQLRTTTLSLIDMLVKEGVLSKANADNLVKQAQEARQPTSEQSQNEGGPAVADAGLESAKTDNVVRVQYVPEFVKNQLRDEIKKD
ncbi:MAG: putative porin, partial [Methylophilaceae bacterium]